MRKTEDGRNADMDWINSQTLDTTPCELEKRTYGIVKGGVFFWPDSAKSEIDSYPNTTDRIDSVVINQRRYNGERQLIEGIYVLPEEDILPALTEALLTGELELHT